MEIIEVDYKEYSVVVPEPYHIFGSGTFANLNSAKVENIHYLLFSDGKFRLGLTVGSRQCELYSPFSAPFGGFIFLYNDIKISQIDAAVDALIKWSINKKYESIHLTIPPSIYHESFISKQANVLFRKGFNMEKYDLNYSFKTEKITTPVSIPIMFSIPTFYDCFRNSFIIL